jgi:hypothetical protein
MAVTDITTVALALVQLWFSRGRRCGWGSVVMTMKKGQPLICIDID